MKVQILLNIPEKNDVVNQISEFMIEHRLVEELYQNQLRTPENDRRLARVRNYFMEGGGGGGRKTLHRQ